MPRTDTNQNTQQERGDSRTLEGASRGNLVRPENLKGLMFSANPQKYNGVASKIHVLENSKQILLCYVFLDGKLSKCLCLVNW